MGLTAFQLSVCRLIARTRIAGGESRVAGGAALNALTRAPRVSRDVDLFHDTAAAVRASWVADRALLQGEGYDVRPLRERESFVQAVVARDPDRLVPRPGSSAPGRSTARCVRGPAGRSPRGDGLRRPASNFWVEELVLEWTADSAFRFFPLLEHPDFGLAPRPGSSTPGRSTARLVRGRAGRPPRGDGLRRPASNFRVEELVLHPFDLATNKVLALVGRLEPRDWVDVITCHERIQPLGYLAFAACGKDPGFGPAAILEHAARSSRYTEVEIAALAFEGRPPSAADLSRRWHRMLEEAQGLVDLLPAAQAGHCVLDRDGSLYRGPAPRLAEALARGELRYHPGTIRGAMPCPSEA